MLDLRGLRVRSLSLLPMEAADEKYVFEMPYDILVYAIGAETNDFNVPGVKQHTFYFKDLGRVWFLNI